MAAVLVGAAIRGSSGVVARAALGQIGAGVRNLAFGVAAAAGVLGAKRRSDSRQEDAILESTHLSDTVEDTLLAEPVTARELCTPLDGTEAANAPLPVVGEAETYAEDTYAEDPGVSATTIWNVARLAVDITRLGVELYKDSTPSEPQPTAPRAYGRGRTLAETDVQTAAHLGSPQPPNQEEPEEDQEKVTRQRYAKGNRRKKIPVERRRAQTHLTNEVDELLLNEGEEIYKKMRNGARAEYPSGSKHTIWSDKNWDYRFDVGHLDRATGARNVMFQVNDKPMSGPARDILRQNKDRGTHKQIFGFKFDTNNFPSYEEWARIIIEASKNPR